MQPDGNLLGLARLADEVEKVVRQVVPAKELETILDNLGLPYSMAFLIRLKSRMDL